ncbi:MAG: hypothetical protein ABEI97_01965 [Candidatus Nanohaloarchaea archaeon]
MNLQRLRGSLEPVDTVIVAALSLVAALPLLFIHLRIDALFGFQPPIPLGQLVILLLVIPLPAAYVASISGRRFRPEFLGAAVTLPLALLGTRFAAFSLGLVLGLALVSYKAKSIFNGENLFWTRFKAAATLLSVMAIMAGAAAVHTYSGSPAVQNAVQENVTETAVDTATEFIDLSTQADTGGVLTQLATSVAVNASRTSIVATERAVFTAVNRSGGFSDQQRQVLRGAFTQAEQEIPQRIGTQTEEQVQQQLQERADVDEDVIAGRIQPVVAQVTAPQPPVLAVLFLSVASLVYLFRLPVGLIAAVYALAGRHINQMASSDSGDARTPAERRQQR